MIIRVFLPALFSLLALITSLHAMPFAWQAISNHPPASIIDLQIDIRQDGVVYALANSGAIYRSTDFGVSWKLQYITPDITFSAFAPDPSRDNTIYGFARESIEGINTIWVSRNSGQNWEFLSQTAQPLERICPSPFIPGLLLGLSSGTDRRLLVTSDEGQNWTDTNLQSPSAIPLWHQTAQWICFFGTNFSEDYGQNWIKKSSKDVSICSFEIPARLFSVSANGFFYSRDQSSTWWPINLNPADFICLNSHNSKQILYGRRSTSATGSTPELFLSQNAGESFDNWSAGLKTTVSTCILVCDWRFLCLQSGEIFAYDETRGDLDGSQRIDGGDLAILSIGFGSQLGESTYSELADLNHDGMIDGTDLMILSSIWGHRFSYSTSQTPGDFPMNPSQESEH